jgi:hypothetical protein
MYQALKNPYVNQSHHPSLGDAKLNNSINLTFTTNLLIQSSAFAEDLGVKLMSNGMGFFNSSSLPLKLKAQWEMKK